MGISEIMWSIPLSFAVFYRAVYQGNSQLNQYEIVSILINGERLNTSVNSPRNTSGADMANHYVSGRKPISKAKVSALDALGPDELQARISASGIFNPQAGTRCLVNLLRGNHVIIGEPDRTNLLSLENDPLSFLARAFLLSVHCPVEQLQVLSKEVVADIINCRSDDSRESDRKSTKPPETASLPELESSEPIRAAYSLRELNYTSDREDYRNNLIRLPAGSNGRGLTSEEIRASTDLFRRSDKTFLLEFAGTLPGLADVLLHHVSPAQCLQLVFICRVHSEKELIGMRRTLESIVEFALASDGILFISWIPDEAITPGEYRIRTIYSIEGIPEDEQKRLEITSHPANHRRGPKAQYQGHIPDFLLTTP